MALSEAERKPYEERAKEKKDSYEKALEEFKAGGGVVKPRQKKMKGKRIMKLRRMIKNPNAPKRLSGVAFGLFRSEIQKNMHGKKVSEVAKAAGEQWKAMPEDEKKVYKDKFATKSE